MRTKFKIFLSAIVYVSASIFIAIIPISAQEETVNIETEGGMNIAWFKIPKALPGHPLASDEDIFAGSQSEKTLSRNPNRTHIIFRRINKKENIWELIPEEGVALPLKIVIGKEGFNVLAAPALLLGGTYTYKDLEKGQLIKIGREAFISLREGDYKVIVGPQINVAEGLIPLSKVMSADIDKLNKSLIIEALVAGLGMDNLDEQKSVASALEKLTGQGLGQDPAKWQEWWEESKGKFGEEK